MPKNQFKPFATGDGANTLDPVIYAAQGYLPQGFQSGIAQPYDINTVLRQVTTMVAGLGQFIADNQGADVLDDGNVANIESKFGAALKGALSSSSIHYGIATGTGDAMVVTAIPPLVPATNGGYQPGTFLVVKTPASANTGAAPTVNANTIGNIAITRAGAAAVARGDIPASTWIMLFFDGVGCYRIGLTPSDIIALAPSPGAANKGGLAKDADNNFLLALSNMNSDTAAIAGGDTIPVQRASDGALVGGTVDALAAYTLAGSPNADAALWHEGALSGSGTAFTTVLTPRPKADAGGINMRLTVGNATNAANAMLDFGFGPKPLVINSSNHAVAGGEFVAAVAHTIDVFYDGTHCRLINPASAPITAATNFAPFSFPGTQNLGNNTTTTISLAGFSAPWGNGNASGFTFTASGIYTIDFQIILQVNTTRNDQTGDATQARFYTTVQTFKNGNSVLPQDVKVGSSQNSVGTTTMLASCTGVFVAGDTISITGKGTGDSFTSGGCSLVAPSYVNMTFVR